MTLLGRKGKIKTTYKDNKRENEVKQH